VLTPTQLCRNVHFVIQSQRRWAAAAATVLLAVCAPALLVAQDIPQRPAGMTDQQIQQQIQARGLGDLLRQRIQQSGLTPDQIRARLRSAGYSENLIDAYIGQGTPGVPAPAPTAEMLRAASALGLTDFELGADTTLARDSIQLARGDSLFLDSLGLVPGVDSIPTKRDSLGVLRLDSVGAVHYAERIRRPKVFGLDVFRRATNQFSPLTTGPVDPDYQLGPGDELLLILTGAVEQTYPLAVTREGSIVIPQVGQLSVANLTLDELRSLLYSRLGAVYSGVRRGPSATTRFEVTVTRIRAIQVFVSGEVVRPGAYQVSAVATIMNALYQAGGPTNRGDFREVRVIRAGHVATTFDIYDYLIHGSTASDTRLAQGDMIFVPPYNRRVSITGSVVRPAIYDLAPGEDLTSLVRMAGGLEPDAYVGRVQIERVLPLSQRVPGSPDRVVLDVALDTSAAREVPLFPDDRITVFRVARPARNVVTIDGNVWRPGDYEVESGMHLSDLIRRAGGLKEDTYEARAHLLRLEPDSTRRLIAVDLRTLTATDGDTAVTDPVLQDLDQVMIYSLTDFRPRRHIAVYGSVQHPGIYPFTDSMSLRDAVMVAGGLRDDAYLMEAEISRLPDPSEAGTTLANVFRVPLDSTFVIDRTSPMVRPTSPEAHRTVLQPYDNIFIRRLPGYELQTNVIITGEVRFPGRYTLRARQERLAELIARAGGLTERAYAGGAQFYRAENRRGRVGIDLPRVLRDTTFRDNFILLPGDSINIPRYESVVQVEGAVNSPVAVAYVPGHDAMYYVDRAGGFARHADKGRTYVTQPNGQVEKHNVTVEPGARVFVPTAEEQATNWAAIVQAVSSVLTSAVALAVLIKQL